MVPIADPSADMTTGYWLIDIANFPTLSLTGVRTISCVPPSLANVQELMPFLIAIADLSPMQWNDMTEMFRQQVAGQHPFAICGWLESDLEIEDLAEHIARFLSGPGPNGKGLLWRYFDPRVFSTAMALFSDRQREALLGPIKNWRFTWCRHWWRVSGPVRQSDRLSDFQIGWPMHEQWPSILQSQVLNRVLTKLGTEKKLTHQECLRHQKTAIGYLDDCVSTLRLGDEDDQTEFVYLCVMYGAAYRRHAKLTTGWIALQRGEISWTDLRFQLDKADFERLDVSITRK
jgi:hypothetical protein